MRRSVLDELFKAGKRTYNRTSKLRTLAASDVRFTCSTPQDNISLILRVYLTAKKFCATEWYSAARRA